MTLNDGTTDYTGMCIAGTVTITVAPDLVGGVYSFTAYQTDASGNVSTSTLPLPVTIDDSIPAAPVIANPLSGKIMIPGTITVDGTAEANATVSVYDNAVLLGTALVDGLGNWTFTSPASLAIGDHILTATTTDVAGNVSIPSSDVTLTVKSEGGTGNLSN